MINKTTDDYIYVVGGHQATGTSMMMRVMIFGGMDAIYNKKIPVFDYLNNPYGVFEGKWINMKPEELKGKVFKCLGMSWRKIPEEYPIKMIKMCRSTEDMTNSRIRRIKKLAEKRGKKPKRDGSKLPEFIERMKVKFSEEYSNRKNIEMLEIQFDDMLNDTENQCKKIAEFLNPIKFDWKKAATAVDKTLKHGD